MTLEQILEEWNKDSKIDIINLSEEVLRRPKMHSKWIGIYVKESFSLKKIKTEFDRLMKFKTNYYMGNLDDDQLKKFGWEPYRLKILKSDLPLYINSDTDIVDMKLKIEMASAKVTACEEFVKSIGFRGNDIKALMDYEKFKAGS